MPILKRECSLYPDNLFEEEFQSQTEAEGARWWAIYTTSRKEKDFMRRLLPCEVPFYCPIIRKQHRSPQGRLRTAYIPLFSNYVFIFANEDQRVHAFTTNCVSQCVPVHEPERLVADLWQIQQLIAADRPLSPEARLLPGDPVRIKSGPFAGVTGTVFRRSNRARVLVSIDFLQAGASVELQDWDLEKIY
jgi:transcription antitermination factor NusG